MVDLHFHLLPDLDDGPSGMPEALALARAAVAAGTTTVVATPHVSWQWPENDSLRIADRVLLFKRELAAEGITLTVRRGGEVALTRAVDLPAGELRRLGLGGGPWLLLECPFQGRPVGLEGSLRGLVADGHRLLLAHPERIPAFREDPGLLARLVDAGMLCQLSAGSFAGRFGRDVQRFSLSLLELGLVHVVASDAHSVTGRPPAIAPALLDSGLPEEQIHWLTQLMPEALLAGSPLPAAPIVVASRGGRKRGLRRAR